MYRHLTDDETRKTKTHLLIESYHYYLKAMNDSQSVMDSGESSEISATSFSSSQSETFSAFKF
jgi:hypothetical protein